MLRRKLRDDIVAQVNRTIENMLKTVSTQAKDKDSESNDFDLRWSIDIIHGYVFPIKTWTHMMEDDLINCQRTVSKVVLFMNWIGIS